ncbi:Six-bladed beta-propeller, TolB-like,Thioredoxin-like fold,NHL repeat,Thioredoxin domain [Cinara cedri]|uniref:Six-bladed beta-propeller, TolB-like,Thioredoxin-like fold,NHL repeat,Thioredoxin domain n=1 Tax=Cinara cedri TaxID=506608 RepID=A0A5E4LZS5_9HEMI|nr:Six-bladed beta-propeller, TolB-like,Thioredoxin-like fold,NHL repeat,Thioredoxin domain [Cinara cedri]
MDRIIEISSVFVELFNNSAINPASINGSNMSFPVKLQETMEDYIQKILTACCSQPAPSIPGLQSGFNFASSGLRVNEFKPNLDWFNCTKPLLFGKHLKGKLVLLDFFTYCCVNCLHILPILHKLQKQFTCEDGLVIIGVHSAKFPNEQQSVNVQQAIEKYAIDHCVVNDTDSTMWNDLAVCCWPTLILIGPNGEPMLVVQGEDFHSELLPRFIETSLQILRQASMISSHKIPEIVLGKTTLTLGKQLTLPKQNLLYPGKVTAYIKKLKKKNNENKADQQQCGKMLIAISDSGHHRILICTLQGRVKHVIGGGGQGLYPSTTKKGFKDGNFFEALFHSPQGICFQNSNTLYVCDTENHAIRMIDLKEKCVKTVAGNGKKGRDKYGGQMWSSQILNTPWDVVYYKRKVYPHNQNQYHTSQQYVPSAPVQTPSPVRCLLIAMAGLHQIWALYLDKTSTSTYSSGMKSKWCSKGLCTMIAGTGKEENRNNSYNGQRASFAQPSGLCLTKSRAGSVHGDPSLYIADSESSSIRRLFLDSLGKYRVINVAGGSPDPTDLFTYGDISGGTGVNSRLQHPMDVAWNYKRNVLYIADSYNHKIKYVTGLSDNKQSYYNNSSNSASGGINGPASGMVHNLPLPVKLNEPNGLHFIENLQDRSSLLLIADTNNHVVWVYNFDTYAIKKLQLEFPKILESSPSNIVGTTQIRLNRKTDGQIMVRGRVILGSSSTTDGSKPLNEPLKEQPQLHWILQLPDSKWESKEIKSNTIIPALGAAADFKYLIRIPKQVLENTETANDFESKDKQRNNKYWQTEDDSDTSDSELDEDEEVIILRCQTSVCEDGDKCIPLEFDFIVRVQFDNDEHTPQAADVFFSYTLPFGDNSISSKKSSEIRDSSLINVNPPPMDSMINTLASTSKV